MGGMDLYKIIIYILIIVIKLLYSTVIYFKIDCNSEETRNVLTFLSFPFPIITGVICIVKYRKSTKAAIAIFVALVLSFISMIAIISAYEYSQHEKYYSGDGSAHIHLYDVSFMDEKVIVTLLISINPDMIVFILTARTNILMRICAILTAMGTCIMTMICQ